MDQPQDELDPPFEIIEPEQARGPVLFNSPHSGRVYPRAFLQSSRLDLPTLRRSEDCFVDDLALGVVARGYPLMRAHFPRCFVDVNREPYELDPRMFEGRLPSFANTRSMRVAGGLGTVARVVGDAQEIYDQRISVDDALRRIENLYKPYHRALRRLFTRVHREFGAAMLIDCHSMPSSTGPKDDRPRADVVLGDRYGTSCVAVVSEVIETTLRQQGYAVSRNKPYAGGFITEHYGNPAGGPACHPARIQPGALHERAPVRARPRASTVWRPTSRPWPSGSPPSRLRNCGPIAPRPNSRPGSYRWLKKKGRRQADGPSLGRKRPRRAAENRAEARYRAAPICSRTAQNASAPDLFSAWLLITPRRADLAACSGFSPMG